MSREELMKLAEKFQKKADAAYDNYQGTGMRRYEKSYQDNDDLATALRMAADAHDDHEALGSMRAQVSILANRAALATRQSLPDEIKVDLALAVAEEVAAYGRLLGLIGKED